MRTWLCRFASFLFVLTLANPSLHAQEFSLSSVPDPLKSWVPWVLDDIPDWNCPSRYNDAQQKTCAWPGQLELKVDDKGASFTQTWQVFRTALIALPGDLKAWPSTVQVDGKSLPIIHQDGHPAVQLTAGTHQLSGQFIWNKMPDSLALNTPSALLKLSLHGQVLAQVQRDKQQRLWLHNKVEAASEEHSKISMFRKIVDDTPLLVETLIRLDIAGKARSLTIAQALLPDSIAMRLDTPLKTNLNSDGSLTVQVVAGSHEIRLAARMPALVTSLQLAKMEEAREEVWVFASMPLLRAVSVEGAPSLDTQQTLLPPEWRNLPAYWMQPGQSLHLRETQRGDSADSPDKLHIKRTAWLSFDGRFLSVQDQIKGEIKHAARLNVQPGMQLGRVQANNQAQLITQDEKKNTGIEVQRGALNVEADSLFELAQAPLRASSWQRDFDQVALDLKLPPGWRLLHASGVDHAPGSWFMQWNLLEIFVVLIIAFSVQQLFGIRWAGVALLCMILTYQEHAAVRYGWLVLLGLIALLRVLPAGALRGWMQRARAVALLSVLLLVLSFATEQVRSALYPWLEADGYWSMQGNAQASNRYAASAPQAAAEAVAGMADDAPVAVEAPPPPRKELAPPPPFIPPPAMSLSKSRVVLEEKGYNIAKPYSQFDPDAKIQT